MAETFLPRRWLLVLGALMVALWFGTLDYRKLIKPDEGRYAEIAREMAVSGDWVTPRLNDLKYFEKPPLQYWATAAAYKTFGEDEWTARLWPALTGFLGIVFAAFVGQRLYGGSAGVLSAAILASSFLYLGIGHMNTLDMGFCFFLQLALGAFLLARHRPEEGRRWMLLTWAALALAVLSKGIAALVLTGGTLIVFSLVNRDLACWKRLELLRGLAIFLAITSPWFVAVSIANPEFPHFFFIHEHFERFLTKAHRRYQPAWYFVPILLAGALPWTTLQLRALAGSWRAHGPGFPANRLLGVWAILVFAFFSVSSSKLPSYILPMFPALAWLAAGQFQRTSRREWMLHLLPVALLAAVGVALAPRVGTMGDVETTGPMMWAYAKWLGAGAATLLGGSVLALALNWQRKPVWSALALALAAGIAGTCAILGHESLSRSNSAYHIAEELKPQLPSSSPLYSIKMYDQTLTFYLGRPVTLVDYTDEMGFGLEQEPHKALPSVDAFRQRWLTDTAPFAIMQPHMFPVLADSGLPMRVVARDTRRVIVTRP